MVGFSKLLRACWFLLSVLACGGCRERLDAEPSVASMVKDPWILAGAEGDPAATLFASCASCHMADGSGRPDGSIPRLAGQREEVLIHKLQAIRSGESWVPAMIPFARALTDDEVPQVARYLAALPVPVAMPASRAGAALYRSECASCHGAAAEGNDGLYAPRLCGQHSAYLERRMMECLSDTRGDANPAMRDVLTPLSPEQRREIAVWLASGSCTVEAGS